MAPDGGPLVFSRKFSHRRDRCATRSATMRSEHRATFPPLYVLLARLRFNDSNTRGSLFRDEKSIAVAFSSPLLLFSSRHLHHFLCLAADRILLCNLPQFLPEYRAENFMHPRSIAGTTIVCALSVRGSPDKLRRMDDHQRRKPVTEAGHSFSRFQNLMHSRIENNQTNQPERSML